MAEKSLLRYQICMFCLTYFSWAAVHAQREFWAMSKTRISSENELPKTFFGTLDTTMFCCYAVAQFFTGSIGDIFKKRKVLTLSFSLQAILFVIVSVFGKNEMWWMLVPTFGLIGLIQSVDFPCLVGTLGSWTTRSSRGFVCGVWATCT